MLRHFGHRAASASASKGIGAFNVFPKWLITKWFNWIEFFCYPNCPDPFFCLNLQCFADYSVAWLFPQLEIPFKSLLKQRLQNQKIRKLIREDVNSEGVWVFFTIHNALLCVAASKAHDLEFKSLDDLRGLVHACWISSKQFHEGHLSLAWKQGINFLNFAENKPFFPQWLFGFCSPRHEPSFRELSFETTEEVAGVLSYEIFVALEEIIHKVAHLWTVSESSRWIMFQADGVSNIEQMFSFKKLNLF